MFKSKASKLELAAEKNENTLKVTQIPDTEKLPFIEDEESTSASKDVRAFVRHVLSEIDPLSYIKRSRRKAFPTSDLRIYVYNNDVDAKKFPSCVTLFDMNKGMQIPTKGDNLPPEKFTLRTNRWVFRDTVICLCNSKPIQKRGSDHALAFSNVGENERALCLIIEFYDLITSSDEDYQPKYLMEHCSDPVIINRAIDIAELLEAETFLDWTKKRQCTKLAY